MSHFTVAVITKDWVTEKDVEEILFPYSENREVKPRIDMTKKEVMDERDSLADEAKNKPESWAYKELAKGKLEYLNSPYKEFVKGFHGEDSQLDSEGNLLTTYNPDSKWDWFVIGGRWKGLLFVKHGENATVSQSRIKRVDWKKMNKVTKKTKDYWNREWEIGVEGSSLTKSEAEKHEYPFLFKKEYYLEHYQNKEMFIKRKIEFGTYAVVTPDGKWHEKGSMGYWGISHETPKKAEKWDLGFYEKFIEPYLDTDYIITIVDCHI